MEKGAQVHGADGKLLPLSQLQAVIGKVPERTERKFLQPGDTSVQNSSVKGKRRLLVKVRGQNFHGKLFQAPFGVRIPLFLMLFEQADQFPESWFIPVCRQAVPIQVIAQDL